jgi:hypothetical protein
MQLLLTARIILVEMEPQRDTALAPTAPTPNLIFIILSVDLDYLTVPIHFHNNLFHTKSVEKIQVGKIKMREKSSGR